MYAWLFFSRFSSFKSWPFQSGEHFCICGIENLHESLSGVLYSRDVVHPDRGEIDYTFIAANLWICIKTIYSSLSCFNASRHVDNVLQISMQKICSKRPS